MEKKPILLLAILLVFTITGCDNEVDEEEKIAYISRITDSDYAKTFQELHLGIIFDFNLKLTRANESWVDIWVQPYKEGEPLEYIPINLSYGDGLEEEKEEQVGFGIITPNTERSQFFIYSGNGTAKTQVPEDLFTASPAITSWDYAIGDEVVGLEPGEEKVLAVYIQGEGFLRGYDFQDPDYLQKMIDDGITVLALKIKVAKSE
ncbi:hypothetical protein PRVXH_000677 [Proteinivorax hydrogeniformans]|uniref:Cyclophilin-like domain-containing protein n=1 Tax=Proteinivorax hydrogeniformans TaxID=1826727 RepID=A0AAU8HVD9_9FIRM